MKRLVVIAAVAIVALAGVAFYAGVFSRPPAEAASPDATAARRSGGAPGGGGFARPPMTVEVAPTSRADVSQSLTVVGNLIGEQTVSVVPKTAGRLESVYVKLGDPVSRGQRIAKVEDREILEQVKQADAAFEVARASIRQREADLRFAETNLNRSKELFGRQLLPKQTLDDADARYQAAVAQVELARAQLTQSQARLEELRINLANTVISSPVDGFVARRNADSGAYVSQNAPIADVVDISLVRLVANIVEKDLRRIESKQPAKVEVDAFPGETFSGRVARVAPVLDPATRTAQIEVEIPNPGNRLKPGMYARARFTVEKHDGALVVPTAAVVDLQGKLGVWLPADEGDTPVFNPVTTGIEQQDFTELTSGVKEGQRIITTGAAALRPGDRIVMAGQRGRPAGGNRAGGAGRGGRRDGGAATPGVNANQAQQPGK